MSFIKALALEKQKSLSIRQKPSFHAEELQYPFFMRVKTAVSGEQITINAEEKIESGDLIACIPVILIPQDIEAISYKDSSGIFHQLSPSQLNAFSEDYALFEYDLLYSQYACFYSANSHTSYKLLDDRRLVFLIRAIKTIEKGDPITIDLGAYFYESDKVEFSCHCEHPQCPQQSKGFKDYPQSYKERLIHRKYIDLNCAAEYYYDQYHSPAAKELIEFHFLTQLKDEEETAFYYFYDQCFLYE